MATDDISATPPAPEVDDHADQGDTVVAQKGTHPAVRQTVLAGIALVLLGLTWFTGTLRADQAKREALGQGLSGLSVTVREDVLRKDAGRLRLTATNVATAGGFASVTFTDANGNVLASTDGTLKGKTLDHMKKPPLNPEIKSVEGVQTMFKAVTLGEDNVIGGISVGLKP